MKFYTSTTEIPEEMLKGVELTHTHLSYLSETGILYDNTLDNKAVPIISGGGSGHEPAHIGYVGAGMLAAAVTGPLFVPPIAKNILKAIRQVNSGKGVFVIIKNFEADLKEFKKAIEEARTEGIDVRYIVSHDDISVNAYNFHKRHRGVAGTILLHKVLGAFAKEGASIDEIEQLALSLSPEIYTLGVALAPVNFPHHRTSFLLAEDEVSFGVGIHGEPGYRIEKFEGSERIAVELVNKLKAEINWQKKANKNYILLVNGLGSPTLMELYHFQYDVMRLLELEGLSIKFCKVGNLMTSCDMSGISLTLCSVKDPKWLDYLNAPTGAFAW
ncbi:DhaKLM operon coactivator DhaQ [Lactococcus cremoris]|uniref:DhaKLM operon coactivator DhaQ n=1 Tax=Lactococcus lactis subsp. cremoris TaxID=1359 RepID=UPI00218213E3|nr:DhaKLM operon coactivator DhaQ [Lactococcus cremoris]MBS5601372.1 DhaKLM operon coactivator DhaQ [Lactococcus lactis]MCT0445881.1 DhaKLM operon coactivator DhaQ [Lactococcus cremoris]MCT0453039.1 DhaKLM operon coactivator DhaQ [Lactococcus cremoris]MCT4405585.1 DhaKLM operon coactivator DhaQ [Lactococcus cremoris]UXV66003.1 DhaKLM operon coactivator DhaQ [Lactococcus cremoris]